MSELNVSRKIAAHMNPLASDGVKNLDAAYPKWANVLKAKAEEIHIDEIDFHRIRAKALSKPRFASAPGRN